MRMLLICYDKDPPSANMRSQLLKKHGWEDIGNDGSNSFMSDGKNAIMSIPINHIMAENIDVPAKEFGIDFSEAVFMSRHSSASGKPTLTVHPVGNYKGAELGGKERTLVRACPHLMADALRKIKKRNDDPEYSVSYEVTHHGPYMESPAMFIEIGSEQTHWGDMHAAEMMADAILSMDGGEKYPVAIGIGGGHYAPRFTEMALTLKVDFGHMIPKYQLDGSTDEEISEMISEASRKSDTKIAYIHRKSMKAQDERRVESIAESCGMEIVSSKDFEQINGI